jgi:hypothetical protein
LPKLPGLPRILGAIFTVCALHDTKGVTPAAALKTQLWLDLTHTVPIFDDPETAVLAIPAILAIPWSSGSSGLAS